MKPYRIPVWKTAPFLRMLLPLIAGILTGYNAEPDLTVICAFLGSSLLGFFAFQLLSFSKQYSWQKLQAALLMLVVLAAGMLLTWRKDIRNAKDWYGNNLVDSTALLVSVDEPPTQTSGSIRLVARIQGFANGNRTRQTTGRIYLYLKKDSRSKQLSYGDRLIFKKSLQRITPSGNPAAFNYARYAAFQQVFHSCYLQANEWVLHEGVDRKPLNEIVYLLKGRVLDILAHHFGSDRKVLGIAEALLIGYKQDLDKDLVQAYTNAGVVHIIAISGLHLGLIYLMLTWIVARIPFVKDRKLLGVVLILAALWLFSLITGASASVLRSAVMFTCIVIGKNFFTQSSLFNSLAASAFLLLCYDPFLLWDVGFQLSYLAVIGISTLQKPIVNLLAIKHKYLFKVWEMFAVTLAAQVSTLPICLYYFHQFPNFFFVTNLVAVPASTLILFIEVFIIAFSWLPWLAGLAAIMAGWMIRCMNQFIHLCNDLPFALWDNIPATMATTCLLYLFLFFVYLAFKEANTRCFTLSLFWMALFTALHAEMKIRSGSQKKLVVYNAGKFPAMDFINGNQYRFFGDSTLTANKQLINFHLRPSRIFFQATETERELPTFVNGSFTFSFAGKTIIRIDSTRKFSAPATPIAADVLIISRNPTLKIAELHKLIHPKVIVFDASNSLWKIAGWKRECLTLALPNFSVPVEGAFVFNID